MLEHGLLVLFFILLVSYNEVNWDLNFVGVFSVEDEYAGCSEGRTWSCCFVFEQGRSQGQDM